MSQILIAFGTILPASFKLRKWVWHSPKKRLAIPQPRLKCPVSMNNHLITLILFVLLFAVILIGRFHARRHLPDDHLSSDSRDTVKLAMGLVATMTAHLLGLLVSSAKGTYDTQRSKVIKMASKVVFLNRVLVTYGPDASVVRAEFRNNVVEAIHRMWPEEAGKAGQLGLNVCQGDAFYAALQSLTPRDDLQRGLKAEASSLVMDIAQLRVLMLAQAEPSIPRLLLIMVACWLLIIFLYFSLLAPPNITTVLSLTAAAVSVAGALFLIMELDGPFAGTIRVSSAPMVGALKQITP